MRSNLTLLLRREHKVAVKRIINKMLLRIKLVTWVVSLKHSFRKSSMPIRSPLSRKSFHRWPICAKWVSRISNPASSTKSRVPTKCTTSWTIRISLVCVIVLRVGGRTGSRRDIAARGSIRSKKIKKCPTLLHSKKIIKTTVEVSKIPKINGYRETRAVGISNKIRPYSQDPHTASDNVKVSHWKDYASQDR